MEGILILIAFWLGVPLLGWIYKTISKFVHYKKYLSRLQQLESTIESIDLDIANSELQRLQAEAEYLFSQLKLIHHISETKESPSVDRYIRADIDVQRSKNRPRKLSSRSYRRRYW